MQREKLDLTEKDGYDALKGHVYERALTARQRYGPDFGEQAIRGMLRDAEVVRFPTELVFDDAGLMPGEFAWPRPKGERPTDGYQLVVHPYFAGRWEVLALLVAYQVPAINYLDVATHEEAELFGATLLGMDVEAYYERICRLADSIPGAPAHDPMLATRFEEAMAGATGAATETSGGCGKPGCGGGSCS